MNEMLGSRIKALRIAKNFTQEQVAEKIGISRQKYARIESGVNGYPFVNSRSTWCNSRRHNKSA